ncbi:YggS family pyridoxal phosphate-dependent enzyme [Methylophilaceae bacterium]|jgi:pyridoxal phosphate enzyme (YggS family)|nr:YggS family pyridoxal phosphate-dependent enzyme [Methylophilaceae bacterium]|tara:strand:+ start:101 stop:772 length:672 start_codon:yes stop_codon:yes gene_type:complete
MSEIKKNINSIKEKLNLHTSKVEEKIRMVAVSKGQDQSKIREAFDSGQYIFGENYLQEAINKQEALTDLSIEWHFIGPIQSNKCKLIAESFSWVQSIDRIKVANKLNDSLKNHASLNICLQVNISNEDSKSGVKINEIDSLAKYINDSDKLILRGLMAIPSNTSDEEILRNEYKQLKVIYEDLKKNYSSVDTLSMGMSNDYLLAIENGANLVRIGSKIFGKRT